MSTPSPMLVVIILTFVNNTDERTVVATGQPENAMLSPTMSGAESKIN